MTPNETKWAAEDARKRQVAEAVAAVWDDDGGVCYPWAALDAVAAPIQRGEVDILAGDTGMGKTTAVCSAILGWLAAGVRVVYHGSEMPAKTMRAYLACLRLGINPGPLLSGEVKRDCDRNYERLVTGGMRHDEAYRTAYGSVSDPSTYQGIRESVSAEIKEMDQECLWDSLHVTDHDFADPRSLQEMGDLAVALEADARRPTLAIVDHIDHLPDGDLIRMSKASVNTVKNHAKKHGTRWLLTSQLNRTGAVGGDVLWRHRPVQESWLSSGKHKTMVAWRVIGVYRPLRVDVTAEELKAVRDGRADVSSVVWQGVNAFNFVKHRHFGSRVGQRVLVGWEKGRLTDLPMSDKLAAEGKAHGIRSNSNYVGV